MVVDPGEKTSTDLKTPTEVEEEEKAKLDSKILMVVALEGARSTDLKTLMEAGQEEKVKLVLGTPTGVEEMEEKTNMVSGIHTEEVLAVKINMVLKILLGKVPAKK